MAFQVSPGVNVSEIDLTTVVPAVSTTEGGIAGAFRWGPVNERVNLSSEVELVKSFGKPTDDNFETFHVASSFLAYGNQLYVVRAADANAYNAYANTSAATDLQVKNLDDYLTKTTGAAQGAIYRAKCPGSIGNSLKVSICDSANAYSSNIMSSVNNSNNTLTFAVSVGANTGTLTATQASQNVTAITVSAGGSGYNNTDVIVLSNGAANSGNCTIVTNSTGGITSVTVVGGGQFPNTSVIRVQVANSTAGANSTNGNTSAGASATFSITLGSTAAANTLANTELNTQLGLLTVGDKLKVGSQYLKVTAIGSTSGVSNGVVRSTLSFEDLYTGSAAVSKSTNSTSTEAVTRYWEFFDNVDSAPGTSAYVAERGGSSDELHVIVADEDGVFTGVKGTILERFERLSRATDAKREGAAIYYKDIINNSSEYLWWFKDNGNASSNTANNMSSSDVNAKPTTKSLEGGADGGGEANIAFSYLASAYDKFASAEEVDISLVLTGKARGGTYGEQLANYLIDNIAEVRKDCVVFASPERGDTVGVTSGQADNVVEFRNALRSSSYGVLDSGYKYAYDRYNDVYRYVPLNGDTAGLCVRTDNIRDPWFSPAGFNRGQIKNIVKLAYNPDKADRDTLYKAGVNPVTTFPGQGTVLFGDKTLLAKPSAFDRINVRRLFIVLEKAIATAAKFTLFEFNDDFTRAQFRNLVEPYLREIQGRRGIYDFKVVCDTTNNTPEVIDSNQFVGDIFIKPARSINFIQLNFVAVRTGVEFSEVVGSV
ncbi:MAG: hypothetical protein EBY03_06010 [Actinobacteria bacterium]|jgi:hypothetical protein|nr:hypothetical protein [Actinomycetota bacterium]